MNSVPLHTLCSRVATWNPQSAAPDDTFNYIDIASIDRDRKQIAAAVQYVGRNAPSRARQLVQAGDVLVSTVRPNLNAVAIVPPSLAGATASTGFTVLRADPKKLDARYLFQWVKHPLFVAEMTSSATGASYPAVTDGIVKNSCIPLPSLAEQKRLSAILDEADALRRKRREAIVKFDTLLQSVFLEMFGDPVKNPKGWDKRKMGQVLSIRRGGSPRPIEKFLGGDINWIKIGDATKGDEIYLTRCAEKITKEGLSKTVHLKAGSLIFANCGVSLGFARILKVDGCIHDGWLAFEGIPAVLLNKMFLLKALNSITQYFRETAPSGTQPNLNTGIMKDFEIILPPLHLQQEFEERVLAINAIREQSRDSLNCLEALFTTLQHQAFHSQLANTSAAQSPISPCLTLDF